MFRSACAAWPRCGLCAAAAALVLVLGGCSPPPPVTWSGYVVAEFVYVAAPLAGTLDTLSVSASDVVRAGAPLFALDSVNQRAARDEAAARLQAAQAQQANLEKGRRGEEQAVVQAQLAQARAAMALAQRELDRLQRLRAQGFVSAAQVDDAGAKQREASARVDELTASLQVARLPARRDEQAMGRANVAAASSALRQLERQLEETRQAAPVAGVVNEVFFVPQAELAGLRLGQPLTARCDGCGEALHVRISHIAAQAEYTPPVIYSNAQRARLVFMVEARPEAAEAARLHPGQPVDVDRPGAGAP